MALPAPPDAPPPPLSAAAARPAAPSRLRVGGRRLFLRVLGAPGVAARLPLLLRDTSVVFMLHRFRDPSRGVDGLDPHALRRALAWLRREGFDLLPLDDLLRRAAGDGAPPRAVAFTVDDGYLEQATVAAPIFAEFDCPATVFVTTGFLDGALWLWWDRVSFVLRQTGRRRLALDAGGARVAYELGRPEQRTWATRDFAERCKAIPDEERVRAVERLAEEAEVEVPRSPPAEYLPMSWDQLRACERAGIRFGPHTVTHPVLSRTSDERSRREIAGSWERLREEARDPLPVFCYPNGTDADYSAREIATLRELGLAGAVSARFGYLSAAGLRGGADAAFRVPRLPFPEGGEDFLQYVSGVERLKQVLRGEARG